MPPIVIRFSTLPGRIVDLWTNLQRSGIPIPGVMMHATPSLGIVRCILPGSSSLDAVESLVGTASGATRLYERLPSSLWDSMSQSVTDDRISQRIKRAFDPGNILNPGILGPLN